MVFVPEAEEVQRLKIIKSADRRPDGERSGVFIFVNLLRCLRDNPWELGFH